MKTTLGLQTGNIILYSGLVHRIQTVGYWLHTDITSEEIPLDRCEPVMITEDWLLRFGFTGDESNISIALPNGFGSELCCEFLKDWCIVRYHICDGIVNRMEYDYSYIKPLKYVHELQNLFYFLCGEELCLKP